MKNCTPLWREAHFQVKMYKTHHCPEALLEVEMSKKCTPLWRKVPVKMLKATRFEVQMSQNTWRRKGLCTPCQMWAKHEGFVAFPKTMAGVGHLKRDLQRCIFRGRRSTRDMFIRDVRRSGQGADFLRGVAFWSIRSSVLGRWFCVTGAALRMTWHHFFVADAILHRQVDWKNRKTHWYEAVSSAHQLSILKEVSQNCFVFDVVNSKNWGSLAELLRFWCCQLQKLRKSRRIASFSNLQIDR